MIVAQLGARMHYAVPKILHQGGLLNHLYTDAYFGKGIWQGLSYVPNKLLPDNLKRFKDRNDKLIPDQKVSSYLKFGLDYHLKRKRVKDANERLDVSLWAGRKFNSMVLKALKEPDHLYVFNSAGKELLECMSKHGKIGFVEQTIAPRELEYQLLMQEKDKYPDWQESALSYDKIKAFADRERAEWELAHFIVCGSDFVKEGVRQMNGPVDKCIVVPYGIDQTLFNTSRHTQMMSGKRKLKVLTVGRLGLRKGTPAIIDSAKKLEGIADFRLVGPGAVPDNTRRALSNNVHITGPVPRLEVHQHYQWADVFLLPSVCEGSATSTYEAMAYGLPVVVTSNTGSIARHQEDGLVIEATDPDAICTAITQLYNDPDLLHRLGKSAQQRAAYGSLAAYEQRLMHLINKGLNKV